MRKTLLYLTVVLFLASCGAKESGDKQAELEALKKERSEIDDKIKTLEKELALNDTTKSDKGELVVVTEIQPVAFTHYIELQGKIDADENVIVTPQMPGVIDAVYVTVGQSVSKGQVLAETDNDAMTKNIETLQSQLAFAKDVFNKQKALWDQKIGSEIQYLSAKNNVETLEKSIAAANEQISATKLISPISGVVDAVDLKVGQIGSPGFQGIRVVNMRTLKAKGEEITPEKEAELYNKTKNKYDAQTTPYYAASRLWLDAIIDPVDTRKVISMGIEAANHAPITKQYNIGVLQT